MKEKHTKIAVLGGDARQVSAADHLAKAGFEVMTWGLCAVPEIAQSCETAVEAAAGASLLLLPLPLTRDRLQVNGTDLSLISLMALLRKGMEVFCGMPDETFVQEAEARGAAVIDYSRDEVFMIRNAQPTVEGAVAIAFNEMRRTLFGSSALVVGYGRIGKLLADLLVRMGVEVTVAARKRTDLAVAELHGCRTLLIPSGEGGKSILPPIQGACHVLFNTVPVPLIDTRVLATLHRDTVLIDLASAPGGIDYDAANRLGLKIIVALALPGKVAPVTAGEIIGDCVMAHWKGGYISS